uniref:Uncharacterized protein n=1 Tax=Ditylenchus dipsaci TaxID=166011 RepID=A0A915D2Y9_9BILA
MLLSVQLCESDLGHGLEQRIAVLDAQKTTLYAISLELNNCLGALDTAASGLLKDIAKDIVASPAKTQEPAKMPAKTPAQTQDQPNYMKTSLEGFLCLLGPCSLKQAVKNEQRMIAHLEVEHGVVPKLEVCQTMP